MSKTNKNILTLNVTVTHCFSSLCHNKTALYDILISSYKEYKTIIKFCHNNVAKLWLKMR